MLDLFVFIFLLSLHTSTASIRVQGKNFRSQQNPDGKQLWSGYEYYARLQSLAANACATHQNVTVDVPPDGSRVALLVGTGNTCTLDELVDYVQRYVAPKNTVDFLILDEDQTALGSGTSATPAAAAVLPIRDEFLQDDTRNNYYLFTQQHWISRYLGRKHHKHDDDTSKYPLYLLSVSFESHFELLDLLATQSSESSNAGGPRITIDAKSGNSGLWIALAALLAACSCSFLMLLQGWLEPDDTAADDTPTRPARRRLTKEQVRELYPVYRLDEEGLLPPACSFDGGDVELDVCAICLDEYEPGDTVRVLPCRHAFHAKCVGKWLSERSAVCPLCKEDYYVEEEEEEEESDEEEETPVEADIEESAWSRMYTMMLASTQEGEEQSGRRDGGWFRRWFRRTDDANLTEPLLEADEEAAVRAVDTNEDGVADDEDDNNNSSDTTPSTAVEQGTTTTAAAEESQENDGATTVSV